MASKCPPAETSLSLLETPRFDVPQLTKATEIVKYYYGNCEYYQGINVAVTYVYVKQNNIVYE